MNKKTLKGKKQAFELPFGMIFSIIAGAIIIFLAIFATTKLIGIKQQTSYSESALAISNSLNPAVNGISSIHKSPSIKFKSETRLYLNCFDYDSKSPYFGSQSISFSEESGFLKKWTSPGEEIKRNNKYIFSDKVIQGKELEIFSVPFYTGFKVDDLVILNMKNYCFIAAPEEIEDYKDSLGKKINFTSSLSLCNKEAIKTCFGQSFGKCDINVYGECDDIFCTSQYDSGKVIKNGTSMSYIGNLIYGAIFSSPEIYNCNLKRLGKKSAELARVYKGKIEIVKSSDCNTVIDPFLDSIITLSENLTSQKLIELQYKSNLMDEQNCNANLCKIYDSKGC